MLLVARTKALFTDSENAHTQFIITDITAWHLYCTELSHFLKFELGEALI